MIYEDKEKKVPGIGVSVTELPKTQGRQLQKAPQKGLTTWDGTLPNAVIRIGELETALKNLGLIK